MTIVETFTVNCIPSCFPVYYTGSVMCDHTFFKEMVALYCCCCLLMDRRLLVTIELCLLIYWGVIGAKCFTVNDHNKSS